jgi:hypothetical protein
MADPLQNGDGGGGPLKPAFGLGRDRLWDQYPSAGFPQPSTERFPDPVTNNLY